LIIIVQYLWLQLWVMHHEQRMIPDFSAARAHTQRETPASQAMFFFIEPGPKGPGFPCAAERRFTSSVYRFVITRLTALDGRVTGSFTESSDMAMCRRVYYNGSVNKNIESSINI